MPGIERLWPRLCGVGTCDGEWWRKRRGAGRPSLGNSDYGSAALGYWQLTEGDHGPGQKANLIRLVEVAEQRRVLS